MEMSGIEIEAMAFICMEFICMEEMKLDTFSDRIPFYFTLFTIFF